MPRKAATQPVNKENSLSLGVYSLILSNDDVLRGSN